MFFRGLFLTLIYLVDVIPYSNSSPIDIPEPDFCLLIFEGYFNRIMQPNGDGGGWWSKSSFFGYSPLVVYFAEQESVYDLYYLSDTKERRILGHSSKQEMDIVDGCPRNSFKLYSRHEVAAWVHVSEPPVNTLCYPNFGTIKRDATSQLIGKAGSLYECATKAVKLNEYVRAVQYDYEDNSQSSGTCTAFYGPDVQFSGASDNTRTSLACALQCNPLRFIGLLGTGRDEETYGYQACITLGLSRGSHSVSFEEVITYKGSRVMSQEEGTCHLYDSTVKKQHSVAFGCYLPPQRPRVTTPEGDICLLIFEGHFNKIMEPKEHDGWWTSTTDPNNVYYFANNTSSYALYYLNHENKKVYIGKSKEEDMNMLDGCPANSFVVHHVDDEYSNEDTSEYTNEYTQKTSVVHVSKAPLNTRCKPNFGIIVSGGDSEPIGTVRSLHECASIAVNREESRNEYVGAVQYDYEENVPSSGTCTAFYGPDVQFSVASDTRNSLACVLQCNPLRFIGLPSTGEKWGAVNFEDCKAIGLREKSDSISFEPPAVEPPGLCYLYKSTDQKLFSYTATGCYLPRQPDICLLIFEGHFNQIMEPMEDGGWRTSTVDPDYYFEKITSAYYLYFLKEFNQRWYIGISFEREMNMLYGCPANSFVVHHVGDEYANTKKSVVHHSKAPLNTLCKPNVGRIVKHDFSLPIENAESLHHCATMAVTQDYYVRAVQYDYEEDSLSSGNCTAFYGPNVEFNVTSHDAYTSLACVLQCNPLLFIGRPGTGRDVEAENFEECKTKGLSEGSDSISFESSSGLCYLYNSTVIKQHSNTATGCYLPRQLP